MHRTDRPQTSACPDWCIIDHHGSEFHRGEPVAIGTYGARVRANLFRSVGLDSVPLVVVAGTSLSVEMAREYAFAILDLCNDVEGVRRIA